MPVRKIPKSYLNVTGVAAYKKAIGAAEFESTLERDFLTLLEFDPNVISFEVQPVMIEWNDDRGKRRTYTPDTLVHYIDHTIKPTIFEVKPRNILKRKWADLRPKFKAAVHYAKQHELRFRIITDKEIRTTYLDNARFLLSFVRRGTQVEAHTDMLVDSLRAQGGSTPAQLISSIFKDQWRQAELLPTLWYLIGTRQIEIDLDQPLNMNTPIRIAMT